MVSVASGMFRYVLGARPWRARGTFVVWSAKGVAHRPPKRRLSRPGSQRQRVTRGGTRLQQRSRQHRQTDAARDCGFTPGPRQLHRTRAWGDREVGRDGPAVRRRASALIGGQRPRGRAHPQRPLGGRVSHPYDLLAGAGGARGRARCASGALSPRGPQGGPSGLRPGVLRGAWLRDAARGQAVRGARVCRGAWGQGPGATCRSCARARPVPRARWRPATARGWRGRPPPCTAASLGSRAGW